ncbi:hypothetical protein LPJ72_000508 [Coemansia sp. Benny D160-2]|nr:hypothetical protein LPJ72_000508 [Coemansia sp. Benny D160-2]
MPRFWKCTNRRGSAVAALLASAGLVSVVGYVLYEIYKEATAADAGDQDPPGQPPLLFTGDTDTVHQPPTDSGSLQHHHRTISAAATGRPYLAISARGILLSGDMEQVHEDAVSIVRRLALKYNVVLVVVVDSEEEQKTRVLELLGHHRIIPATTTQQQQQQYGYPLGLGEGDGGSGSGSVVWVEKARSTAPSSPTTSDDDGEIPPSELPSSAVSSILKAPASLGSPAETGAIPRANVLFCQTEEGKQHLVRHLLTLRPPCAGGAASHSYAGHIDTNMDVACRLAMVLHSPVVLVAHSGAAAFSSSSAQPPAIPRNVQIVGDITQSVFFAQ